MKHKTKTAVNFFFILMIMIASTACQTAIEPLTGRRQYFLTSVQTEITLGQEAWTEMLTQVKTSTASARIAAVERVGRNIAAAVPNPGYEWEFKLFASEQANAFALPGGKVGIYEGLFDFVTNDAELAAVIGHEIAHAIARHGGERMSQAMLLNIGALGLNLTLKGAVSEERQRWLAAYAGLTTVGLVLPYSRKHEYAADRLGTAYMAKAGYNPQAAITFWERFGQAGKSPAALEFLSTHPVHANRIKRLKEHQAEAYREYNLAKKQLGLGQAY